MFWSRVSKKIDLFPSPKKLWPVPPSGTGRHMEVRGSTYKGKENFLEPTSDLGFRLRGFLLRNELGMVVPIEGRRFSSLSAQRFGRPPLFNLRHSYTTQTAQEQKSKTILVYLTALVCAMVGCTYAAVPLYRRFCQATGYGGTVQRRETVEEKIVRHAQEGTTTSRELVVQFNADVADGMPWKFIPTQREVRVKPGESALAFYTAENHSSTPITGVSTYNVTPMKAAVYFNKIQCFCFEEQRLLPGEQIDMPVFFYIDPEFETDPKMDGINNIILSYTFFKVSD
ncbi:cytochrome c oxidase assembly protein CtaG / Cox11 family [Tasmannia lanceolata]|uniref:cytochrome c oxidase assembly protein CtaG / Cox11 family n=1 Tax=Tasmannia lanceolata TaxID=3420 RepID=UPI004063500F